MKTSLTLADLRYRKVASGDYSVFNGEGVFLMSAWRPPHHPSRWLVSVGNAPVPFGTRKEAVGFGLAVIAMEGLWQV